MKQKRVIVSVTNDLATDQRVKRHCRALHDEGYNILLTGRLLPDSLPIDERPYKTRRIRHLFNKGVLFYAEYNVRLFFFLIFSRCDILHANDLDTLPANFLASRIRRIPLIYDSHEYFTEVPELAGRKTVKKVWELIERQIFPHLRHILTVNRSIASAYKEKYGKEVIVLRNLPEPQIITVPSTPSDFNLPMDKKLVILQGAGINKDRGAEEAAEAMRYIKNALLIIAGKGDIVEDLRNKVNNGPLKSKVIFIPPMPYEKLIRLTSICHCGLSLDKDTNLNYRYSLPNKLFDYIMAGTPVLVSGLPELRHIVEKYRVGLVTETCSPKGIAEKINHILYDVPADHFRENLIKAAEDLNWDCEKAGLISLYRKIGRQ